MANGLLEEKSLQDIAAAIRVKNGKETTYKPADMADAIMELKLGGSVIVSNEVSEVYILDGETTINVPKTENAPEVGDYIIAQTKNGNDYDAAVFSITAVDKDSNADNYVCSVKVSDTLDVIGVDSSDATALATDIIKGKTAYINNEKVTGTLEALTTKELGTSSIVAGKASESDSENNILEVSLTNDLTNDKIINNATVLNTKLPFSDIATTLNIKSADIVTGKTILGVAGAGGAAGGIDTSDATATASDMLIGKTAYVDGNKITGTLKTKGTVKFDVGGVLASHMNIETGAFEGVDVSLTNNLSADEIINSTSELSATIGASTIQNADPFLTASNIASGKEIFGVEGTFTSDATAVASNLIKDKTAYVNGQKITGLLDVIASKELTVANVQDILTEDGQVDTTVNYILLDLANGLGDNQIYNKTTDLTAKVNYTTLVGALNIKASDIAKGKTIAGIEGTFEATTEKENKITELEAEVARLQAIIDGYQDLNEKEF